MNRIFCILAGMVSGGAVTWLLIAVRIIPMKFIRFDKVEGFLDEEKDEVQKYREGGL